jgi:hypothetical protein
MYNLAFTESVELKDQIHQIDAARAQLLLMPLSPKTELKLRWETKATRIHSSLALSHNLLSRGQVVKILASTTRHIPTDYRDVLAYKKALEYIEEIWTGNTKPITFATISTIADFALIHPKETIERSLKQAESAIRTVLEYLENQADHPVIQAGIALCALSTTAAIPGDGGLVARLVSGAFLARYGYDVRGLQAVERNWLLSETSFEVALKSHAAQGNLNHWLLFYTQSLANNLRERVVDLTHNKLHQDFPASFWELNERQKAILQELAEPTTSITNKKVQKLFDISQITASRDLSKLATLGLIFPHGKGRSVSYTRT